MNLTESLLALQDLDGQIRELDQQAKELPRLSAKESARLKGVNAALTIAKQQLADLQKRIQGCEEEAQATREKVRTLRISQATAKSNKEFMQLNIQIEGLEREADTADARQVALRDDLPKLEADIVKAQANIDAEQGGVDGVVSEFSARLKDVKAELDRLNAERAALVSQVSDKRALLYYERIRTKRWPVVVPLTDGAVCDGCHLVQPPSVDQMVEHNVKAVEAGRPQSLVACTMCGRILYRA